MLAELVARPYCLFRSCNKICLNYCLPKCAWRAWLFVVTAFTCTTSCSVICFRMNNGDRGSESQN